ncbi:MAG: GNAT family N-acetyltransferase [Acidimicrobiales bacterium]
MVDIQLTGHGVEQFSTLRLIGRRLLPADTDFLAELHSSDEVMELHGGQRSRATTEPFVQSNVAHWRQYQFGLYVISMASTPDDPIGRAGLRWDRTIDGGPAVDVSVLLAQSFWGQGIATEITRAIVSIGLDLELPLIAGAEAGHAAARRVLEKVGFVYDSPFERHEQGWVRYRWPSGNIPPGLVSNRPAGR